ncbi:MAG: branched-chain amino acid transaminase [Chloroflexi bacterium]|nr:MAG: branched-chain amino acid transaminase [Chloroflexota bacterium]
MTQTVPARQDIASGREQSWVYFNGDIVRYADAKVGLLTHALNYGTGIFEGIRAYWNERKEQLFVMRMPEHYERMQVNARTMLMKLEPSIDELCAVSLELLRRNAYREDAYLRPLLFKAAEVIGVRLHDVPESLGIVTTPMGDYVGTEGIRCMISSWRRIDDNMAPVRAKATGLYVNAALAKSEALQAGFDEAIMLGHDGHVSEGSGENIFVVRRGQLLTPPPSDNILEGITRATIIHLAREELGLEVQQRSIDRTELYMSDEIFMCGTGAQVAPVIEVDRRRIGDGEPGPMSLRLKDLYLDLARGDSAKYAEWLTPVY